MSEEEEEYEYESDPEELEGEGEDYNYSGSENGGDCAAVVADDNGAADAHLLSSNEIELLEPHRAVKLMRQHCSEVEEMLGLDCDAAMVLLHFVRWERASRLAEKWFENSAKLAAQAGLPPSVTGEDEEGGADADATATAATAAAASGTATFVCPICAETLPEAEGFAMECGHCFCNDCWAGGLRVHVATAEVLRLTCFDSTKCQLVVPPSVFEKFLPEEDLAKYQRWSLQQFTECSSRLQHCPEPRCQAVAFNPGDMGDMYREVNCRCGTKWCFNCRAEPHKPACCADVIAWNSKSNDSDLTQMYIKANTKACPQCGRTIQKDEGCAHMRCTNCQYHFCWLCLGPYSSHSEKTGGFYACNKFEERVKAQGRSDEERSAMLAARQLRNYEMAFERHLNHKAAMEAAQRELQLQMETALRALADDGVEETQLRFAVDQVINARRVLAWSYVFKFYQFEDEHSERELQLFETYQGKLEHMTEELQSRLTEVDHEVKGAAADRLPVFEQGEGGGGGGGGGLGGNGTALMDSFHQWRLGVVHLMGAVRSFTNQVVDFAANPTMFGEVEWEQREEDVSLELEAEKDRVVWAWRDDSNTWTPFSDENIRIIEEASKAEQPTVQITSSGRRYRIDLVGRRQTNLETHGSRSIRRTVERGGHWTCNGCSYHNSPGATHCLMCEQPRD